MGRPVWGLGWLRLHSGTGEKVASHAETSGHSAEAVRLTDVAAIQDGRYFHLRFFQVHSVFELDIERGEVRFATSVLLLLDK